MEKKQIANPVSRIHQDNIDFLKRELGVDKSFDVVQKDLNYAGLNMSLFFIDGFAKDESLTQIQRELMNAKAHDLATDTLQTLMKSKIPYIEVESTPDLDQVVDNVLAGPAALVVEGIAEIIMLDTRTYPVRGPEEPDTEQLIRGAKDGYVETIVMNTALTRRRVRDRTLRTEYVQVGRRSKTDIVVTYIEDIADPKHVQSIKQSLQAITTDGLPMGDKTIEEFIFGQNSNPYPLVRYTERPDVAASHLFEGHILIIVDGSPSVMITPATFWHHLQHAEEYRQKPIIGAGLRFVRFFAVMASLFLLPLWYLYADHPWMLPEVIDYIGPEKTGSLPLFVEFILAEIGIEMLRMASIHTPSALATALGLVAAILIGQVAIEVGLFSSEVVLYVAIAAIGSFATPSYELSLANRLVRVIFLTAAAAFHMVGFVIAVLVWTLYLARMKVFETPYLWPFLPFSFKGMVDVVIRSPIPLKKRRPAAIHPADPDR